MKRFIAALQRVVCPDTTLLGEDIRRASTTRYQYCLHVGLKQLLITNTAAHRNNIIHQKRRVLLDFKEADQHDGILEEESEPTSDSDPKIVIEHKHGGFHGYPEQGFHIGFPYCHSSGNSYWPLFFENPIFCPTQRSESSGMSTAGSKHHAQDGKLRAFKPTLQMTKKEKEEEERKRIENIKMQRQKRIAGRTNSTTPNTGFSKQQLRKDAKTVADGRASSLSTFARNYPFLVTKSHKAASISGYPTEVLPQLLYLGDMENAKSKTQLAELKISHVLTIHSESVSYDKPIVHMFLELADEPMANIAQYFDLAYNFIRDVEKKGGRVLVHCGAGASRSATLCAAYLMRTKQWGVDDTLKYLKERRSQVNPNSGFISALHEYEKRQLLSKDTAAPSQICCGLKEHDDRVGSVHELQLEIQKDGNCIGFIRLVVGQVTIFGRDPSCNVILDHASISRQHAKMETTGDTLILTDLRSRHGTFLNGKLLKSGQEIVLSDSDGVRFGSSTRNYILRKKGF